MIDLTKDIVDYVIDNVPNPMGVSEIKKFKYSVGLANKKLRGEYIICVKPIRIDSNVKSRGYSYPEYSIAIHCVYFMGSSVSIVDAHERLFGWMNDVFDKFHLESLGGLADVCKCDVSFGSHDYRMELGEHAIGGTIGMRVERYIGKS